MKNKKQIESDIWARLHEYGNYALKRAFAPISLSGLLQASILKTEIRTLIDILDDDVSQEIINEVERLCITL